MCRLSEKAGLHGEPYSMNRRGGVVRAMTAQGILPIIEFAAPSKHATGQIP
jgi:hypothetical protein